MWESIKGIIRHLLTFGAGFLVASDLLPADQVEAIVGAVMTLIGIVWSVFDKKKAQVALDKAIAAPEGKAE